MCQLFVRVASVLPGALPPFRGLFAIHTCGSGLWRWPWLAWWQCGAGLTPTVVGAIPYEGIKFGVYDYTKSCRPAWVQGIDVVCV